MENEENETNFSRYSSGISSGAAARATSFLFLLSFRDDGVAILWASAAKAFLPHQQHVTAIAVVFFRAEGSSHPSMLQ
jgi:hypothetical protein